MEEIKYTVLTVVGYASDFAQHVASPSRSGVVSKARHSARRRAYGPPKVIYVNSDQRWISGDFQSFLR